MQLIAPLGFHFEPVNLNLNPALRQVVLKDVAGLLSPADASRQCAEKEALLAELDETVRTGIPESEPVKRAALKLNAERQMDRQAALLRQTLEAQLSGSDNTTKETAALAKQVETLTAQLQEALALAAEERTQREQADGIRAAVEKRLQELETDLVAAETRSAAGLKKIARLEKTGKKQQTHLDDSERSLKEALAKGAAAAAEESKLQAEIRRLHGELQSTSSRRELLEQKLKAAEDSARTTVKAAEQELVQFKEKCLTLESTLEDNSAELQEIRRDHARQVEKAAADKARITELEAALEKQSAGLKPVSKEVDLQLLCEQRAKELAAAHANAQKEHKARKCAEQELEKAQSRIDELEQAAEKLSATVRTVSPTAETTIDDRSSNEETEAKLREVEAQLAQERQEAKSLSHALDVAVKKIMALEAKGHDLPGQPSPPPATIDARPATGRKPLPHETRPAPKAGALFHPKWELSGLPCRAPEQVLNAWESVYNVQLALEGYPSQYCAAFMVVLKEGAQKRIYLLFDLKKDQHLLVCVPGTPPKNEAGLKKLVTDAQKYLKMSGFELEKIPAASIASTLQRYFSPPSP